MSDCTPTDHDWNLMQFERGVAPSRIIGGDQRPFYRASFVCQCGAAKVVVRRGEDLEMDDPDGFNTPAPFPPSQQNPEAN